MPTTSKRIAILGCSGAGKSTFARRIGAARKYRGAKPVHELRGHQVEAFIASGGLKKIFTQGVIIPPNRPLTE